MASASSSDPTGAAGEAAAGAVVKEILEAAIAAAAGAGAAEEAEVVVMPPASPFTTQEREDGIDILTAKSPPGPPPPSPPAAAASQPNRAGQTAGWPWGPPKKKKKALLALDGGGLHGIVACMVLEELERRIKAVAARKGRALQEPFCLAHYFDCVAGTSTGSVMAAYLCMHSAGMIEHVGENSVEGLIELYEKEAQTIFPPASWIYSAWITVSQYVASSKYTSKGLRKVLESYLKPDASLAQLAASTRPGHRCALVVNTFDVMKKCAVSFFAAPAAQRGAEGPHHGTIEYTDFGEPGQHAWDPDLLKSREAYGLDESSLQGTARMSEAHDYTVVDTVMASTAAPGYLPPAVIAPLPAGGADGRDRRRVFCDGSVASNNPVLEGINLLREAAGPDRPLELEDIAILSIGTTNLLTTVTREQASKFGSIVSWLTSADIISALTLSNSDMSHGQLSVFYQNYAKGAVDQYLRVQLTADYQKLQDAVDAKNAKAKILLDALEHFDWSRPEYIGTMKELGRILAGLYGDRLEAFVENYIFPDD